MCIVYNVHNYVLELTVIYCLHNTLCSQTSWLACHGASNMCCWYYMTFSLLVCHSALWPILCSCAKENHQSQIKWAEPFMYIYNSVNRENRVLPRVDSAYNVLDWPYLQPGFLIMCVTVYYRAGQRRKRLGLGTWRNHWKEKGTELISWRLKYMP